MCYGVIKWSPALSCWRVRKPTSLRSSRDQLLVSIQFCTFGPSSISGMNHPLISNTSNIVNPNFWPPPHPDFESEILFKLFNHIYYSLSNLMGRNILPLCFEGELNEAQMIQELFTVIWLSVAKPKSRLYFSWLLMEYYPPDHCWLSSNKNTELRHLLNIVHDKCSYKHSLA